VVSPTDYGNEEVE
jgi:hypothetical protein